MNYRQEKDSLGQKQIDQNLYWGLHTQRAKENFSITNYSVNFSLIKAIAMVKKACCLANFELGYLPQEKSAAIVSACDEIIEGKLRQCFPLDALQGGAGTSTNMNVNEVVANRVNEILGGKKGDYSLVHPIEDVNLHQSTNDVYPTAVKIACIFRLRDLSKAIASLQGSFQEKEKEFAEIVKIGRTELQNAVPMTLGAEFSAFAEAFSRDRWRTFKCEERLRVVNIGGTSIGTGLGAPRKYIFLVIEKLREITGLGLARSENLIDQTANTDAFVEVSGILKAHSSNLIKIANDLRLLHLLGEIELAKVQVGSSAMPGKVNPVILEAVIQAGIKAAANDYIVTQAASRSAFQINEFMPLLSFAILESMDIFVNTASMLADFVAKIKANPLKCIQYCDKSSTLITAFVPQIGYDRASELIGEFTLAKRENLREFLIEKLGSEMVKKVLSPSNLMALGYRDNGKNA